MGHPTTAAPRLARLAGTVDGSSAPLAAERFAAAGALLLARGQTPQH
jgi:hypothetical protein